MSENRKLIVLWGIVVAVYAALFLLTNPLVMLPHDRQEAIYHDYVQEVMAQGCDVHNVRGMAIGPVAARHRLTDRAVLVIVRHGYRQGWGELPCGIVP